MTYENHWLERMPFSLYKAYQQKYDRKLMVLEETAEQRRGGWEMPRVIGRQECGSGRGRIQRISAARKRKRGRQNYSSMSQMHQREEGKKKYEKSSLSLCAHSSFIDPLWTGLRPEKRALLRPRSDLSSFVSIAPACSDPKLKELDIMSCFCLS